MNLVTPPIHPAILPDESTRHYLSRLAKLNGYESYTWLIEGVRYPRNLKLQQLVELLDKEDWTGYQQSYELSREIGSLDTKYMAKAQRFCPLCISQDNYWKAEWELKATVCCTKHQVWLSDTCDVCSSAKSLSDDVSNKCSCGSDFGQNEPVKAPSEVLELNDFVFSGIIECKYRIQLMPEEHELTLNKRLMLVETLSRLIHTYTPEKTGVNTILNHIDTAKSVYSDIALALLGGEGQFKSFLQQLTLVVSPGKKEKLSRYKKFYLTFYKLFNEPCFEFYKEVLEESAVFALGYINQRNSLFSKDTLNGNVWLPPSLASLEFQIPKSKLLQEAANGRIRIKSEMKKSRKYTLLFAPDIEARVYSIRSQLDLLSAAALLGTTKGRMLELCRAGVFESAVPPEKNASKTWQICADEVRSYLNYFNKYSVKEISDGIRLPDFMQKYGNTCSDLFLKTFNRLCDYELEFHVQDISIGLRGLLIDELEAKVWLAQNIDPNTYSVCQASNVLRLHQEFMYELVNKKIIKSTCGETTDTRVLDKFTILQFTRRFVMGRSIAEWLDIRPKDVESFLADYEVYPIDHDPVKYGKLRQKMYSRAAFLSVPVIYPHILNSLDWAFVDI